MPDIFKKYDIRGVVGVDLHLDQIDRLTHAIVNFYQQQETDIQRIAVAMDGRLYSYEIYQKVSQAIIDKGLQVYFLGICPNAVFMYGIDKLPVQAGIMITGSHFSKEYNGFKLYLGKKAIWGSEIQEIKTLYDTVVPIRVENKGKIVPCPIIDQYVESMWQNFPYLSQYDFSMVIDCAHSAVGPVMKKLVQKMGWSRVTLLYDSIDGEFPVHDPDPTHIENMKELQKALTMDQESFGIGFDGDASRMIGMEQNGSLILGDRMLALFAQDFLKDHPQSTIVYDVKSSMLVQEIVEQAAGNPVQAPAGAPLVKESMERSGALLGGELSGHYFFKDRHPGYDDGIYAMFRLLDILVKERKSIYELLQALPEKYSSYEIRIPCADEQKHEIVKQISLAVSDKAEYKTSHVDGIRAEMNEGWGLVRACNSQPMVSFRCEAKSKKDLKVVKETFKNLLQNHIQEDVLKHYF